MCRTFGNDAGVYEQSARYVYDILNTARGKDYEAEAVAVAGIIGRRTTAAAPSVLDVGCGTGRHLAHLSALGSECVGVDASAAMLSEARRRVGELRLEEADFRTMDLGRTFDAVICLNGTIGYMTTYDALVEAVGRLVAHLSEEGVLIIEPWFAPDQWLAPKVTAESAREGEIAVARVSRAFTDGGFAAFEWHCAVATPERAWSFVETHYLALYEIAEYLAAVADNGLVAQHEEFEPGRGLGIIVGTRP